MRRAWFSAEHLVRCVAAPHESAGKYHGACRTGNQHPGRRAHRCGYLREYYRRCPYVPRWAIIAVALARAVADLPDLGADYSPTRMDPDKDRQILEAC